jgi:hypothetical protein
MVAHGGQRGPFVTSAAVRENHAAVAYLLRLAFDGGLHVQSAQYAGTVGHVIILSD